jgi:hypothetical protein
MRVVVMSAAPPLVVAAAGAMGPADDRLRRSSGHEMLRLACAPQLDVVDQLIGEELHRAI